MTEKQPIGLLFDSVAYYTPNDVNIHLQSFLETVKAFSAWDSYQGDTSIVIAIVDNGFQQNHIDLKDNIAINWKEIENNEIDDDTALLM